MNTARNKQGKYDYNKMELICQRCFHTLGVHAGENETNTRPCFNSDGNIEKATGAACDCPNFTMKQKREKIGGKLQQSNNKT